MKILIFAIAFLCSGLTQAQTNCPVPQQNIVMFFGNGINTSAESASLSVDKLQLIFGDSYNGERIRYDLAYNKTEGIAKDLLQSAEQAAVQFDSEVVGWLTGLGIAPPWFNAWYQKFLTSYSAVIADELNVHVAKYLEAIHSGQKVLVVSHSQGNFYANAAKKLLFTQLTPDNANNFAIFGVAVPTDNIGGASGPYYTNHRDFIYQAVPKALPQNWTLQRNNGVGAEDIGAVQAHFFDSTYLSSDFDIQPALIIGVKALLNTLKNSTPVCDQYRKHTLNFFEGRYALNVVNDKTKKKTLAISSDGKVTPPFGAVLDWTTPLMNLSVSSPGSAPFDFILGANRRLAFQTNITWDEMGAYKSSLLEYSDNTEIARADADNPTYLKNKKLTQWMMLPANGMRAYFRCRSEVEYSPVTGVSTKSVRVPVSVNGTTLTIKNLKINLEENALFESAKVQNSSRNDVIIEIDSSYTDGYTRDLIFGQAIGLTVFTLIDPNSTKLLICVLDK